MSHLKQQMILQTIHFRLNLDKLSLCLNIDFTYVMIKRAMHIQTKVHNLYVDIV